MRFAGQNVIKFLARSNLPPRLVKITSTKPVLLSYSFSAVFEHPVTGGFISRIFQTELSACKGRG